MGRLDTRLALVEEQAAALDVGPADLAEQIARRDAAWCAAANAVLASMPPERAAAVGAEVRGRAEEDDSPWTPITRRVLQLAWSTVPSNLPEHPIPGCACSNHFDRKHGPLVLPEAVCALLEAVPPDEIYFTYACERCGYQSGERAGAAWRAALKLPPAQRPPVAYFPRCPLDGCGGAVHVSGQYVALYKADQERRAGMR